MTALTRKRKVLAGALLAGALAAIGIVGAVAAFSNDSEPTRDGNDEPVAHTPGAPTQDVKGYLSLHQARLDLAERLGIDPADIRLRDISFAGFDGCLGVYVEGEACTMIFIGGAIVLFEADGETYRYHVAGDQFVATDFVDGEVTDGMPLEDAELRPDVNGWLAAFVRGDLALRLGVDFDDISVEQIHSVTFSNLCLGFLSDPEQACAEAIAKGAIVILGHGGESYRYHASAHGIVAVSFEEGEVTIEPEHDMVDLWQKLREDLADRLGLDVDTVSAISFKNVQWSDGCLGVYYKDSLCTMAIVDGFVAVLATAGDDTGYVYYGAGQEFHAVSFLDPDEVRFGHPMPAGDDE